MFRRTLSYDTKKVTAHAISAQAVTPNNMLFIFTILFFAIFAAVYFPLSIGQYEYMVKLLLDGCDTPGVSAFDHIGDLLWHLQIQLFHNDAVLDDIDCDVMVDKTEDVKIQHVNITFHLQDILFPHYLAAGVLDDRHGAVQLVQLQVAVNRQAFSGLDMVKYKTFLNLSYIQHTFTSSNVSIRAILT